MKEQTRRLLSGLAALMLAGNLAAASAAELLTGDADGSEIIDLTDAQLALQHYVEDISGIAFTRSEAEIAAADVNADGKVDLNDAQYILTYYVLNTVSDIPTDWDTVLHPLSDIEQAKRVLEKFLNAYMEHDVNTMLDTANYRETIKTLSSKEYTEEELIAELDKDYTPFESYVIGEGYEDKDNLELSNSMIAELRAAAQKALDEQQAAETPDEELIKNAELALRVYQPLEKLIAFPVTVTAEGEEKTDTIYLVCPNGKWQIDVSMVTALIRYVRLAKISSANSAARSVYNAFNSAAVDLDESNVKVINLTGDYYFTAEDFADTAATADANSDNTAILKALCAKAASYYDEIGKANTVAVHMERGVCKYAAVLNVDDIGWKWFGTNPNRVTSDTHSQLTTIEEALRFAEVVYDEG